MYVFFHNPTYFYIRHFHEPLGRNLELHPLFCYTCYNFHTHGSSMDLMKIR